MPNLTMEKYLNGGSTFLNVNTAHTYLITTSTTFNVPVTGKYLVVLCGGAGSGASYDTTMKLTSGNSGDIQAMLIDLTAGENITVTIGAGGPGVLSNSDGNRGGITSFGSYFSTKDVDNGGKLNAVVADGGTFKCKSILVNNTVVNSDYSEYELVPNVIQFDSRFVDGASYGESTTSVKPGGAKSYWANGGKAGRVGTVTPEAGSLGSGGGGQSQAVGYSADGGDGVCSIKLVEEY